MANSPIELCHCENAWLKQLVEDGGSVLVDDADCGGGAMWSAMTLRQLLGNCTSATAGKDVTTLSLTKKAIL